MKFGFELACSIPGHPLVRDIGGQQDLGACVERLLIMLVERGHEGAATTKSDFEVVVLLQLVRLLGVHLTALESEPQAKAVLMRLEGGAKDPGCCR